MKMLLVLIGCMYFFAPGPVGGIGMRVLTMVLIVKLALDAPSLLRRVFGRERVV